MEGGSFKSTHDFGFVRAKETLNSNATKDFRWSVWLTGGGISGESLYIGIASKLHRGINFRQDKFLLSLLYLNNKVLIPEAIILNRLKTRFRINIIFTMIRFQILLLKKDRFF